MSKNSAKMLLTVMLVTVLIAGGISYFFYRISKTNVYFPALPTGAYYGEISALDGQRHHYAPFFVESHPDTGQLLITAFLPNWKPQLIKLQKKDGFIAGDEKQVFEPLALSTEWGEFKIFGRDREGYYKGKVLRADGLRGAWKLTPLAEEVVTRNSRLVDVYTLDLARWLKLNGELRYNRDTLTSLRHIIAGQERNNSNMESHIIDQNQLKERAQKQKQLVEAEIGNERERQKVLTKEVADYVDQLALLNRISKQGRLVSLARQITTRENKWYLANWQGQEDVGVMAAVGGDLNIDLTRLNEQTKQAQEVIALKDEINREKHKIQELKKELSAPAASTPNEERSGTAPKKKTTPGQKGEEPGFFEKVFGF